MTDYRADERSRGNGTSSAEGQRRDKDESDRSKQQIARAWSQSRRSFLASGLALSGAAVSGCLGGGSGADNSNATTTASDSPNSTTGSDTDEEELPDVSYRHRYERTMSSAVNAYGEKQQVWETEGIDVDFVLGTGSSATAQAVGTGEDEFGNTRIGPIMNLIQEEASMKIIGQAIGPMAGVLSLEEAGITSWSDLKGKTVGRYPWGSTGELTKAAMEQKGQDPSTVTWQSMQPGSELQILMEGKIDAAVTYFPQAVIRLRKRGYDSNVLVLADVLDNLGVSVIARERLIENEPDLVNNFVRGWLKAHQLYVTELDQLIEYHKTHVAEFNEEIERETMGALYASRVPPKESGLEHGKGWTSKEKLKKTQEVFHSAGLLEETVDVEEYYTNEFIERNKDLAIETAETYYEELENNWDVGPNYV